MFLKKKSFLTFFRTRFIALSDISLKRFTKYSPTFLLNKANLLDHKSLKHDVSDDELEVLNLDSNELKIYKSMLKSADIDTLERLLIKSNKVPVKAQEFSTILKSLTLIEKLDCIQDDHLYLIIKFLGDSIFRKKYIEKTSKVIRKYLDELKRRGLVKEVIKDPVKIYLQKYSKVSNEMNLKVDFLLSKLPNIIISCSKTNLYDEELFKCYQTFLEHNEIKSSRNILELRQLLALFWAYKRLNRGYSKFYEVLLDQLKKEDDELTHINCLRLIWMIEHQL